MNYPLKKTKKEANQVILLQRLASLFCYACEMAVLKFDRFANFMTIG